MLDVINNIAAQNRFGNTRTNSTANIRTDFMAIFQIFIFQNIAAVRLNKDRVSIFAGAIRPLCFRPKISAALVAINLPNIGNDIPRFCTASSNMTSMQFCSPAIPPHACMILPAFISGGHGEWSDTGQSISPLNSFPTFLSGFLVANWRRTFCRGANLFELIGIEDKIVRARFTGDILTFLTRARYFLYPSGLLIWQTCRRQPAAFARYSTRRIASTSVNTGREAT